MAQAFRDFCDQYGNAASVLGFALSFVGFALTLWTVWRVKRDTQEAKRVAVLAVQRIGDQLLENEIGTSLRMAREAKSACRVGNWPKAAECCDETIFWLAQVRVDVRLLAAERLTIDESIDKLAKLVEFLERIRPNVRNPHELPERKEPLDVLIAALSGTQGRLRRAAMEIR